MDKLETEITTRLLNQLGLHIPPKCSVALDDFKRSETMLVRIINLEGAHLGYVWFGTDPHNNWAWDGLVRVGDDTYVIWQVFDRYSDGTYCRIRCQPPRTAGPSASTDRQDG